MNQNNNHKDQQRKRIAILGSTGSIGGQALEVIEANQDTFEVSVLTANTRADDLIRQAKKFNPNAVVITDKSLYAYVKDALYPYDIKVFAGQDSLEQIVTMEEIDIVLTGLVGFSGLRPTVSAIKAGKSIALANKETLVVAGELITKLTEEHKTPIIPVDSEHSAIFQCIVGEFYNPIEKIFLTASGGPFRGKSLNDLRKVSKAEALNHPVWDMGAKITIDSATLMNKGLEVIEAKWLFGLRKEQVEVVVHPQSIIHSMVQFEDGSVKAQMGLPDMRLPIQYALGFPRRLPNSYPRLDFSNFKELTFEKPDTKTFKNLELAFEAINKGGNTPCMLNAANEIVVEAFLQDKIRFLDMPEINERCISEVAFIKNPSLEDYIETDKETRIFAKNLIT